MGSIVFQQLEDRPIRLAAIEIGVTAARIIAALNQGQAIGGQCLNPIPHSLHVKRDVMQT